MKNSANNPRQFDRVSTREEIAFASAETPGWSSKVTTVDPCPCFPWMPAEILAELDETEISFLLSLVETDLTTIN